MAVFFFDTFDGEQPIQDGVGLELPDRKAARVLALEALPDLARDVSVERDSTTLYVNVRNEDGQSIYTATLSMAGRWLD